MIGGVQGTAYAALITSIPGLVLIAYETRVIMKLSLSYYLKQMMGFHIAPIAIGLAVIFFIPIPEFWSAAQSTLLGLLCLLIYYFLMYILKWIPPEGLREHIKAFRK
jgi:ABC-type Fe3+ transport system permease subunit